MRQHQLIKNREKDIQRRARSLVMVTTTASPTMVTAPTTPNNSPLHLFFFFTSFSVSQDPLSIFGNGVVHVGITLFVSATNVSVDYEVATFLLVVTQEERDSDSLVVLVAIVATMVRLVIERGFKSGVDPVILEAWKVNFDEDNSWQV